MVGRPAWPSRRSRPFPFSLLPPSLRLSLSLLSSCLPCFVPSKSRCLGPHRPAAWISRSNWPVIPLAGHPTGRERTGSPLALAGVEGVFGRGRLRTGSPTPPNAAVSGCDCPACRPRPFETLLYHIPRGSGRPCSVPAVGRHRLSAWPRPRSGDCLCFSGKDNDG